MSVLLQVPEGSGVLCPAARHTTATSRGPDRNWGKGMVTYHYFFSWQFFVSFLCLEIIIISTKYNHFVTLI